MSTHIRFEDDNDMQDEAAAKPPPQLGFPPAAPPAAATPAGGPTRLGLTSYFLTSYERDQNQCYVFDIVHSADRRLLAASLSNNSIKLLQRRAGEGPAGLLEFKGDLKGHQGRITSIDFALPDAPHALYSSSEDGTIRGWDVRTGAQVEEYRGRPGQEMNDFAVGGGHSHHLVAGASNPQVVLWDRRRPGAGPVCECVDVHMEDVTKVCFPPGRPDKLISASVDGLACVFDVSASNTVQGNVVDEDEDVDAVLNVGISIANVGFYGDTGGRLWCLTTTEELALLDWVSGEPVAAVTDTRAAAQAAAASCGLPMQVDYLIDCAYNPTAQQLFLAAGSQGGEVAVFPVGEVATPQGVTAGLGPPCAYLAGAHTDVVRTVDWHPLQSLGIPGAECVVVTGGEDSKVCTWAQGAGLPASATLGTSPYAAHDEEGSPGGGSSSGPTRNRRFNPYGR